MISSSGPETQGRKTRIANGGQNTYFMVRITIAACLVFWVFVFSDSGWGPILAPLADQLHISLVTAGLMYAIWSTGYLPGALVGGVMLDRYGARRVFAGAVLWVFGGIACIFLGLFLPQGLPIWVLIGIAGLAGMGGGIIDATSNGLISTVYQQRRGVALNLFNLLYPLGGVIIALVDAWLLTIFHNDPRPAFLFTLSFALIALLSLPGLPETLKSAAPEKASTRSLGEIHRPSWALVVHLIPVILVMILASGVSSCVRAWAPAYLHVAFAQTPASAAVLSSITWALAALSRVGAAGLVARLGSWRVIMLGLLISIVGLIALIFSPSAILATLAIASVSIGLSPLFATCLATASEQIGHSFGFVAGLLLCASGIGTVICNWLFGFLLNTTGPVSAVLCCLLFVFSGTLLALRLRPARARR